MSNLIDHAIKELELAGYKIRDVKEINTEDDYNDACGNSALELIKVFSNQDHSGFSGGITLALFKKLANFENLTPLTDNPEEWRDCVAMGWQPEESHGRYQSLRNSSCFSDDLKTYYDIDNPNDNIEKVDEDGAIYTVSKPWEEREFFKLQHVEIV